MVRGQGSRSPVSCESTLDLFDAPVSWALLAACERAAVDMPEAIVAVFETDIVAHAGVGKVAPWMVPPHAPVGTDVVPRETVGSSTRWRATGQLMGCGVVA
jgi:hypothetical protein